MAKKRKKAKKSNKKRRKRNALLPGGIKSDPARSDVPMMFAGYFGEQKRWPISEKSGACRVNRRAPPRLHRNAGRNSMRITRWTALRLELSRNSIKSDRE